MDSVERFVALSLLIRTVRRVFRFETKKMKTLERISRFVEGKQRKIIR